MTNKSLKKNVKKRKSGKGLGRKVLFNILSIVLFKLILIGILFGYLLSDMPDIEEIAKSVVRPQITIYDAKEVVLAKYGDSKGKSLIYSQIPTCMVNAVIAAEDRRFFSHFGIDIFGIIRAYIANLRAGRVVQGGSTITQQLAKIIWLTPERTIKRKLQEILIAIQLERRFSKEQIMTLYLNRVYLGRGNYGIDAAAAHYFGKSASELNAFESAIIAALLRAPSKYSASQGMGAAISRARYILDKMHESGYITAQEYKSAKPPTIIQHGAHRGALKEPYFADYVLQQLQSLVEGIDGDISVYTTLDLKAQSKLEHAVASHIKEMNARGATEVAGLSVEHNGAIKAMVGGSSYIKSQFNRAVQAERQPGSAFKFFVYLAGFEYGLEAQDIFVDEQISLPQGPGLPLWSPRNYDRKYRGAMTLQEAFNSSINTVTVKISQEVGIESVIEIASRLGVQSAIPKLNSIALGTSQMTLYELVQAYAHVANAGYSTRLFGITKIKNRFGEILYEHPSLSDDKVLDSAVVTKMKALLFSVVSNGSGKKASVPGMNVYGKTGTSQDFRDAWFIGFTDELVTGIWIGNDDNSPTKDMLGGVVPALIFKEYNLGLDGIAKTVITTDSTPWLKKSIFDFFN